MSGASASPQSAGRGGWVTFAAVLFLLVGAFNVIDGIVALVNDDYFVADELLFGDLAAWGVWFLFVGVAQAVTGWLILARRFSGVMFGIAIAAVNALTQLMWIGAYPAWSIAAMVVDGVIIWALTTHYDEF